MVKKGNMAKKKKKCEQKRNHQQIGKVKAIAKSDINNSSIILTYATQGGGRNMSSICNSYEPLKRKRKRKEKKRKRKRKRKRGRGGVSSFF